MESESELLRGEERDMKNKIKIILTYISVVIKQSFIPFLALNLFITGVQALSTLLWVIITNKPYAIGGSAIVAIIAAIVIPFRMLYKTIIKMQVGSQGITGTGTSSAIFSEKELIVENKERVIN